MRDYFQDSLGFYGKKLLDLMENQPLGHQEYNILNELLSKGKLTYFDLKRYKIKI